MSYLLPHRPVMGCKVCENGTSGIWGCPEHSPLINNNTSRPSIQSVKCNRCGKEFDIAWACDDCQIKELREKGKL